MYDRQVRRRRAVLAALVVVSLILLTASFGESAGLGSVQRQALNVLSPIQEGANRALKPFRDLFGWAGDTIDAKQERDDLKQRNEALERRVTQLEVQAGENEQLRRLVNINDGGGLKAYDPESARVISRSPNLFYSRITIDKGASAGVRVNQPVVNGEGLVGRVTLVARGSSQVTLLTDETFAVSALAVRSREPGTIQPALGAPGDLLLDLVPQARRIDSGERIVTAGTTSDRLESLFPPGILIGTVRRIDDGEGDLQRRIHVRPAADLRDLQFVEVLTRKRPDLQASATP